MRKIIIYLALFLCISCIPSRNKNTPSNPFIAKIDFIDSIYDFGVLPIANPVIKHSYHFRNSGSEPLIILSATPSCHCTSATYNREVIQPGQTDSIVVTFDATGDNPGVFYKSVMIRTNTDPDSHTLFISGIVE